MKLNVARKHPLKTHEGAPAVRISPVKQLRRLVCSCLLWEDNFYVDGKTVAEQIVETARKCPPLVIADLALEARKVHNLRHVPLLLLDVLTEFPTKQGAPVVIDNYGSIASVIAAVIQRADEITELLAVHWRDGRKPVPHQMRKGLALAFQKFNEYHFAKYDRDGVVKLRDALRIARPDPSKEDGFMRSLLYKNIIDRKLATPDTWETQLSAGKDKRETFERLIREGKLGYLALLRNLRNIVQADCDMNLVAKAILARKGGAERVLPFRYIAAVRAAPQFAAALDKALCTAIKEMPVFKGTTLVLVDVSGSMNWRLSQRSDLKRIDAAAALASLVNGESVRAATFSDAIRECAFFPGIAGVDTIINSQPHYGTELGRAVDWANRQKGIDRLIVISDEQTCTPVPAPKAPRAYMINVASERNGVGYGGPWVHLDGFSEGIFRYLHEYESEF